jgi:WD40 repeat protein
LTPPLQHRTMVYYAEFSPDGRRVVTACDDGTARVWEFESNLWPVEDLRLLAQLLSGRTIDATGGFSSLSPTTLKETLAKLKSRHPEYFQVGEKP